jgi:hypothetical protein
MNHVLLMLTPNMRWSWWVLMPFFDEHRRWTARNHVVSGIFDRSNRVPTVAVILAALWFGTTVLAGTLGGVGVIDHSAVRAHRAIRPADRL